MKQKNIGVVYTPENIVDKMLDMAGFNKKTLDGLRGFKFVDLSCGEGAILVKALYRWLEANKNDLPTGKVIEETVYGIDIDNNSVEKCKENLSKVCEDFGYSEPIEWKIYQSDALDKNNEIFQNTYEYVFGNPPYIDIHDMDKDLRTKASKFFPNCKNIYYAFYKLGLEICKDTFIYISPREWFKGPSAQKFREYLKNSDFSISIFDFLDEKVFPGVGVLSEITLLKKAKREKIDKIKYSTNDKSIDLDFVSIEKSDGWYFLSSDEDDEFLNKIFSAPEQSEIIVKNGCATLLDSVFISKEKRFPGSKFEIPFCKASKEGDSREYYAIFPYREDGTPVSLEELKTEDKAVYDYLCSKKDELLKRNFHDQWFNFGRSQSIKETFENKITITSDGNGYPAEAGVGVFGGLYIMSTDKDCDFFDFLNKVSEIFDDDFSRYKKIVGRMKCGDYYMMSSKYVQKFVNYKISEKIKK